MDTCKNCVNRVFDERWGEYKCTVFEHRIYDIDRYIGCEHHKKKQEDKQVEQLA